MNFNQPLFSAVCYMFSLYMYSIKTFILNLHYLFDAVYTLNSGGFVDRIVEVSDICGECELHGVGGQGVAATPLGPCVVL